MIIALAVLLAALLFMRVPLPEIQVHDSSDDGAKPRSMRRLWAAVGAQFCYVGAQVGVASFFIRFAGRTAAIGEQEAAYLLSIGLLLFMAGRFIGTALLRSMHATTLLGASAGIAAVLAAVAVMGSGMAAVGMLIALQLFMSIMFPTIFSLGIEGLGSRTKLGSSLLVMSIAGGAVIPPIMGALSDRHGIQLAYLVPLGCFLAVLLFARTATRLPA